MQKIKNNIIWLDEVDSTNSFVLKNIKKLANKTIIASLNQTAGRGTKKRKFFSVVNKTLTFSILIKDIKTKILNELAIFSAVVLIFVLKKYNVKDAKIKWFNDIFLNEKKLAGILVESITLKNNADAVIGIGININATKQELCSLNLYEASSIFSETKIYIDPKNFLFCYLYYFNYFMKPLLIDDEINDFKKLKKLYNKNCYTIGKTVKIYNLSNGDIFVAKTIKMLENNNLLVLSNNKLFSINPRFFSIKHQ